MKCLFRFKIGEERTSSLSRDHVHGLGHAMRCYYVSRAMLTNHHEVFFLTNKSQQTQKWLHDHEIDALFDQDEELVLRKTKPDVVICDINYLLPDKILFYRKFAPVVNFAPRGLAKFYADLSFLDIDHWPEKCPKDAGYGKIFHGLPYAVVGETFVAARKKREKNISLTQNKILIAMGGSDPWNLTLQAIQSLNGLRADIAIKIILGPLYRYEEELRSAIVKFSNPIEIFKNPKNMAEIMVDCDLGIFAAGILSFEALAMGIPGIHLCGTEFHLQRASQLTQKGMAVCYFPSDELRNQNITSEIENFLISPNSATVRRRAFNAVDGKGVNRILQKMKRCLKLNRDRGCRDWVN